MRKLLLAATLLSCARLLPAQVGVPPAQSPFRDLEHRVELSLLGGWFMAGTEPVGVAPKSAPYIGARYDISMGSLVSLSARASFIPSTRSVIDPAQPEGSRVIGEANQTIAMLDGGVTFHPVGSRTYRRLSPIFMLGIGMSTGLQARDAGGYGLTPRIMITYGAGLRWYPGERMVVRLEVNDFRLGIRYPSTYFVPASDGTRAREGDSGSYTSNPTVSLGLSYRILR